MAKIILMADGAILQEMTLSKERITIGRRPSNDIVIDNLAISGQHALITTIQDDSFLEDLGSTNGTQVNGQPVKRHFLQNDDVIELAKYRIKYQSGPRGESGAAAIRGDSGAGAGNTLMQSMQHTQIYTPTDESDRQASLKIISGAASGRELQLTKARTTIGRAGIQVAAISRGPQGYTITLIEGERRPILNGRALVAGVHALQDGDVLDLGGTALRFILK